MRKLLISVLLLTGCSANTGLIDNALEALDPVAYKREKENEQTKIKLGQCRKDFDSIPVAAGSSAELGELERRGCLNLYVSNSPEFKRDSGDFERDFRDKWDKVCISSLDATPISSGSLERLMEWKTSCQTVGEQEYLAKLDATRAFLLEKKGRIQTFNEASFAHKPEYLREIANSPLLRPDGKVYGYGGMQQDNLIRFLLDAEEDGNILRAQLIENHRDFEKTAYVFLRINKNTILYHSDRLRIGGEIGVIGRYVENAKYRTVGGSMKVAPTLEVLFMEAH